MGAPATIVARRQATCGPLPQAGAMDVVRSLVSKKKNRFVDKENGFNLDLSYITENIIAMGFPSEGSESLYRNPMSEVQRFFDVRHKDHFKIYNLCSERSYDLTQFFPRCERFGFDDHNPCPLALIKPYCESMDEWLTADPKNVASVHCKAGKGRTGTMICAYLVHSRKCATADEALFHFGVVRTKNAKGVTIPSQMRYVHYYEQQLLLNPPTASYQITHIRFVTVPSFDGALMGYGCDPYFSVTASWLEEDKKRDGEVYLQKSKKFYDYKDHVKKIRHFRRDERFVDLDLSTHGLRVRGDTKLVFYDKDKYNADGKMFQIWFHTAFVENNYLCFEKSVIDKACKDKDNKLFDPNFKVEIFLHKIEDENVLNEIIESGGGGVEEKA
jgi:phosphatidylinositol-3,4,5-trisphosphate 3-phosphatase/dual-specificity protein phosphatase PTEN